MTDDLRIGVDLGGTKIEAVVIRVGEGAPDVLARKRIPTNRALGYDHILGSVADLIAGVRQEAAAPAGIPVGVGMPGSVTHRLKDGGRSPVPLVKGSNTVCLNDRPFFGDLMARVGQTIAFSNDANCFALAETRFGAAKGARVAFGVIMGTGLGGGVVMAGADGAPRVWDGVQGIAGEWGHITIDPENGPLCFCGRRGCLEQYLCGPAIEAAYAARSGEKRSLVEIVARTSDDAHARDTLQATLKTFGRALSILVNLLDPDVVVLGGGVSNIPLFVDEGPAALLPWIFNDEVQTRIVKNALGDSAGVFGAALLR